ncbi:unnamed protein product [Blepharisma stoltei]|uniref:Uncharacterized protein n=1 Tax=Blepharisma stoltei TaxID=1481888 RepID=A0AAU9K9N2_9CILI|nr:unnamed protein product [Blepharisma stoltei]
MGENFRDKVSVFSGMFSLISNFIEGEPSRKLPKIQFLHDDSNSKEIKEEKKVKNNPKSKTKKQHRRKNTACPHANKRHYARNMCSNCYHKFGRQKEAWMCPHKDLKFYAKGLCKACYLKNYHQMRTSKVPKEEN